MRALILSVLVAILTFFSGENAMADPNIQQLTSPKGITVWLVESHQIPMVSVEVVFRAGGAFEPAGKDGQGTGLANLTASMLDEGAGNMDAKQFKEALDAIGARFGAGADKLDSTIHLSTLSEHKDEAFRLMGLALNQPRFAPADVARIKAAIIAGIKQGEENPGVVASKQFMSEVFGDHPYGWQVSGSEKSVAALTDADARNWWKTQYTRANMVVGVVGDITPAEAVKMADATLATLPAGTTRNAVTAAPRPTQPQRVVIQKDIPQASVMVGHLGLPRDDKDYFAMLVMNEILGGGALTSRLGEVVREKHGLVYDVRSVNMPLPLAGTFFVQLQTENAKAQQALTLVKEELERIKAKPVEGQEFSDVIDYLAGSFPLRIDSNAKILDYLTLMQMENLGPDYLNTWVGKIRAVTPADVQRVAKRLIHEDKMALTIVGDGPALGAKF
jgi:zinc protease